MSGWSTRASDRVDVSGGIRCPLRDVAMAQDTLQMTCTGAAPAGSLAVLGHPGLGRGLGPSARPPWPTGLLAAPDACALPERAALRLLHGRPRVPPKTPTSRSSSLRHGPSSPIPPSSAPAGCAISCARSSQGHPPSQVSMPWWRSRSMARQTGDHMRGAAGAQTCGPFLSVDANGRLSLRTRSIHRPSLFDVVDVILPLHLAALPAGFEIVHARMPCAAFIMAALDLEVPLREVQIAARHADPRTTAIYDRRRENFDRHAAFVVVAFVAGA